MAEKEKKLTDEKKLDGKELDDKELEGVSGGVMMKDINAPTVAVSDGTYKCENCGNIFNVVAGGELSCQSCGSTVLVVVPSDNAGDSPNMVNR